LALDAWRVDVLIDEVLILYGWAFGGVTAGNMNAMDEATAVAAESVIGSCPSAGRSE